MTEEVDIIKGNTSVSEDKNDALAINTQSLLKTLINQTSDNSFKVNNFNIGLSLNDNLFQIV